MKVSHNWLSSYFQTKIPDAKKLEEIFTNHLFEVEGIEEKNNDLVIEGKVLPDRAHYLLCHRGVAREIMVLTGLQIKEPTFTEISSSVPPKFKVEINDKNLCRRYIAREVTNITETKTPDWIKNNLEAIGQKSINFLVDVANFVMFDVGQPMHIFDADKIDGGIFVRNAKEGEEIILLTGEKVILSEKDLVIADNTGPLAIAGVKGGKRAEVTNATKNIVIESANFKPSIVRRTSTKYNLRNDSSKRFENEISEELAGEAMREICVLIKESIPNANFGAQSDIYPEKAKKWKIDVKKENIEAILGVDLKAGFIEESMQKMGCEVKQNGELIEIIPPFERLDLKIEEDIADEIGRVIGYDKISSKNLEPLSYKISPNKIFYYSEKIKNILSLDGYSETLLYSLVDKGHFEIAYPLASDKSALREKLSKKLAESLTLNSRNSDLLSLESIKLFEIGEVFTKNGEETHLAIGINIIKKKKGVLPENILKDTVSKIESGLGIKLDGEITKGEFGYIWEANLSDVIKNLPEKDSISDLGFKSLPGDKKFQKFSAYPFVSRDIAVFVPMEINPQDVEKVISENVDELCIKKYLFDVFEKEIDGQKKKSIAFRLIFQSFERTLTVEEVNPIMEAISKAFSEKGWVVR